MNKWVTEGMCHKVGSIHSLIGSRRFGIFCGIRKDPLDIAEFFFD